MGNAFTSAWFFRSISRRAAPPVLALALVACVAEGEPAVDRSFGDANFVVTVSANEALAEHFSSTQSSADEEPTVQVEHPMAELELSNGNLLQLFVGSDGGVSVVESGFDTASGSVIAELGEDLHPLEIWQLATPAGERLPSALIEIAGREGLDLGDGRGLGAVDALVAHTDPQFTNPVWCDGVGNDVVDFQNEFCTVSDDYDSICGNTELAYGQSSSIVMPTARLSSRGGWCRFSGLTLSTLQYATGSSWTTQAGYDHSTARWKSYTYSSTSAPRRYRLTIEGASSTRAAKTEGIQWECKTVMDSIG